MDLLVRAWDATKIFRLFTDVQIADGQFVELNAKT